MEEESKISLFGVVVKTSNIERLRNFYRDVVGLGPPVVDSNFWVEFKIGPHSRLFLEAPDDAKGTEQSQVKNTIDWVLRVDDLEEQREHMKKFQIEPFEEERERFDKKVVKYLDPDGNIIHIITEKDKEQN